MFAGPGRWLFQRPYLLLSLTSLLWAINIVLGRFIVGTVPPVLLAQIRWTGAGLILLPFAWSHLRRDWPALRRSLPLVLLMSFAGITCYNTMAYYGLQSTEALNALLMQSSMPLLIGLWTLALFDDRLGASQILGIGLSLGGVLLILTRGDPAVLGGLSLNPGDLWIVAGLALYALYSALLRKRPPVHWLSFLAFTIIAGAAMHLPLTVAEFLAGARMQVTPAAFGVLAYVVLFPSAIANLTFNRGVELIGANRAGPFFHLLPVFGSAIAILFLGERPRWFHAAGYAAIVAGILVAQRAARRA